MSNTRKAAPRVATVTFDPDDFTIGEVEDYEDAVGRSFQQVMAASSRSAREIRGIVWLLLRRETPEMTFEETRSVKLGDVPTIVGVPAPAKQLRSASSTG